MDDVAKFLRLQIIKDVVIIEKCVSLKLPLTVYVSALVGHLKNVSPTIAQMPNRITNVEFTTVSPLFPVRCWWLLFLSVLLSNYYFDRRLRKSKILCSESIRAFLLPSKVPPIIYPSFNVWPALS